MRKIILFICSVTLCCAACNTQSTENKQTLTDTITSIEFESKAYSFGQVVKGEIVEHSYFFTNTGNIDLIIEEVDPSCGCTTPEWTKEPVKPGEKGKIKVRFDTQHQSLGNKTKQVAVYSNTSPTRNILQFSAQVVAE